jgi:hypothetical protein
MVPQRRSPAKALGAWWDKVSRHPLWSAVIASLSTAAIVAAVASLFSGSPRDVGLGTGGRSTPRYATSQVTPSATAPKAVPSPRPGDGHDLNESGCPPSAENVPCTTVTLERESLTLATVGLRYSPVRDTTWGMVKGLGSEQKLRLVTEDGTVRYARLSPSNTNGDKFFQTHGCVRSIQVTEHDRKTLDRKRVRCP